MTGYISEAAERYENAEVTVNGFLDPQEALEHIEQNGCDILFSDAALCGTDGLTLLRRLQQKHPQISVVLTTAYEEYVVQAVQMQVRPSGYLALPATPSKTKALLDSLLPFLKIADAG